MSGAERERTRNNPWPSVALCSAGANGVRADHNVAGNNHIYGISAFDSTHGRFDHNTVFGTSDAGIHMGDSLHTDFAIQDNTGHNSLRGILVRDAPTGRITGNSLTTLLGARFPEFRHRFRGAGLGGGASWWYLAQSFDVPGPAWQRRVAQHHRG